MEAGLAGRTTLRDGAGTWPGETSWADWGKSQPPSRRVWLWQALHDLGSVCISIYVCLAAFQHLHLPFGYAEIIFNLIRF